MVRGSLIAESRAVGQIGVTEDPNRLMDQQIFPVKRNSSASHYRLTALQRPTILLNLTLLGQV